jgi:uncharacterized protein YjiK
MWISAGFAQSGAVLINQVRVLESDKTGLQYPTGLAFSSKAGAFYVIDGSGPGEASPAATNIISLTPFARRAGTAQIAAQIRNPINVTFDNKIDRLLILEFPEDQLLDVRKGADGNPDPKTLIRYDVRRFGLQDPQGMTVDPASGYLFILDAVGPRIVRVEPGLGGNFDEALISEVNLQASGLVDAHGLAIDPTSSHLYLVSPAEQKLYELTQSGRVVANHDLSKFQLGIPQGMVFAPSGDQTDSPLQMSLYLADSGTGQIFEFSQTNSTSMVNAASSVQSSLIRVTNLAAISPPSPDPDGLVYLPLSNTLLMSDSEVEEIVNGITHFAGANLWELTLNGSVVRTANISTVAPTVVPMTNEPTGVTWNPTSGHFYISDDDAYKIWDLNPGNDGLVGTADDSWTSFDTLAVGDADPEDVTYDSLHNQLFVVDGTNMEIYQYTVTGSLVGHFDVGSKGVVDPEGVVFNPDSGTLFVLSNSGNPVIIETTTNGTLLQTIDVSADNASAPGGVAYGPASDGSGAKRFYIVDRGVDNNNDPHIIDGKMYEMSAPSSSGTPTVTNSPSMTPSVTNTPISTPTSTRTPTVTNSRTMTPSVTNTPISTPTSTFTPTVTNSRTMTPSVTNTPISTPTSTFTPTLAISPTLTPTSTYTPMLSNTPVNTSTSTPTTTASPVPSSFPQTGILDSFNRADGAIGTNWTFDTASFKITGNQLVATSGGMIFWKAASFGPEQEAYITFVNIDAATTNMDLLLKSQTTSKDSFLEVGYNPVKKIILVESYTKAQGYVTYGASIPVTFSNGDQLGVRVGADGKVNTYKNGVLLGVRDVSAWTNYTNGGYIGLLSWGGTPNTTYDNFGGGTLTSVTPTYTATTASSPTYTPTMTKTASLTATGTFTPTAANSPSMTPSVTNTPISTPTSTNTPTVTNSRTMTPSVTNTPISTPTSTLTPTVTNSRTMTPSVTNTPISTPTSTFTPTVTNSRTMTPSVTNTPISTPTSTRTPTVTNSRTMTPSVTNTPISTPTSTFTPTLAISPTLTPTSTYTPMLSNTPVNTSTSTPTTTASPVPSSFPQTGILDSFNRADGAIGTNWTFDTASFKITGNQLVATSGGMIFWKAASFGPEQEAYITFVNIDAATTNMDLLLKSQTTSKDSFLEVGYNPVKKIILVESYTKAQGYVTYGASIPVTFSNGDQLGVRVGADGKVNTYKNGVLLGVRDVSAWTNYTNGGYIGLLSWGGTPNTTYDNFGGGTLTSVTPT